MRDWEVDRSGIPALIAKLTAPMRGWKMRGAAKFWLVGRLTAPHEGLRVPHPADHLPRHFACLHPMRDWEKIMAEDGT